MLGSCVHVLLSPSLAGCLVAAGVDRDVRARERSSDHAPVWIELADADTGSARPAQRIELIDAQAGVAGKGVPEIYFQKV
jgi:hypothetical protein